MRKHVTPALRQRIFERDSRTCQYCGAKEGPYVVLEIDHVLPRSKGGTADETNLVTACFDCNRGKRSKVVEPPAVVSNLLAAKIEEEAYNIDSLLDESLAPTYGG